VSDLRNSRIPDIVNELRQFGIAALVHDPMVRAEDAMHEYRLQLSAWEDLRDLDAIIFAVPHDQLLHHAALLAPLRAGGVLMDVKSALQPSAVEPRYRYWCL
jgi:UDP-N-acetyl-D-galactosamine dehydrogenase